jgi:hypothetical protein
MRWREIRSSLEGAAIKRSIFQAMTSFNSRRLEGLLSSATTSVRAVASGNATDQRFLFKSPAAWAVWAIT